MEVTKENVTPVDELTNGVTKWKLRRAPKQNWSGMVQYDHTEFKLAPLVSRKTGRPATGLTKEDAERIALEMGREKHEFYDNSPFWEDFFIGIDDGITTIDITDAEQELIFRFLKAHKLVAFGHKELKTNAKALFVLYNDVDEAKSQNKARNAKKIAYAKFAGMDNKEMIDVLMVMGEKVVSTDPNIVEAMMGRLVEKRPGDFVDIFGDEDFKMKLFVTKCLHFDILQRGRGKGLEDMTISFNGEHLGEGLQSVVEVLKKKVNQPLYLALSKQLEIAQGAGTLAGTPVLTGYQIEELAAQNTPKGKKKDVVVSSTVQKGTIKPQIAGKGENIKDTGKVEAVGGQGLDSPEYDDNEL